MGANERYSGVIQIADSGLFCTPDCYCVIAEQERVVVLLAGQWGLSVRGFDSQALSINIPKSIG